MVRVVSWKSKNMWQEHEQASQGQRDWNGVECLCQNLVRLEIRSVERGICPIAESIMTNTVISLRCGNFGYSAINKGYSAYFSMCIRKTALFLLPIWNLTSPLCSSTLISCRTREFWRFANVSGINWRIYLHGFSGPFGPKWRFWGQNRGRGGAMLTSMNSFLFLGVVTSVPLLAKIDREMQPSECTQTDRRTHSQRQT